MQINGNAANAPRQRQFDEVFTDAMAAVYGYLDAGQELPDLKQIFTAPEDTINADKLFMRRASLRRSGDSPTAVLKILADRALTGADMSLITSEIQDPRYHDHVTAFDKALHPGVPTERLTSRNNSDIVAYVARNILTTDCDLRPLQHTLLSRYYVGEAFGTAPSTDKIASLLEFRLAKKIADTKPDITDYERVASFMQPLLEAGMLATRVGDGGLFLDPHIAVNLPISRLLHYGLERHGSQFVAANPDARSKYAGVYMAEVLSKYADDPLRDQKNVAGIRKYLYKLPGIEALPRSQIVKLHHSMTGNERLDWDVDWSAAAIHEALLEVLSFTTSREVTNEQGNNMRSEDALHAANIHLIIKSREQNNDDGK